jgi:hypothetical protein
MTLAGHPAGLMREGTAMDDTDRAVRDELERRLAVIEVEGRETPQPAFPRSDMIALIAIVVVTIVVGLIVGIA